MGEKSRAECGEQLYLCVCVSVNVCVSGAHTHHMRLKIQKSVTVADTGEGVWGTETSKLRSSSLSVRF